MKPWPHMVLCLVAVPVAVLVGTGTARAQVDADPLPGDPRLVVFSYDANNSFRVYTRPMASTHIELASDERIKVLALGDTAGWMTAARDNHIFIKPRYPHTSTSGTLITTKRTYQFLFRSTQENGRWYQRVSFQNPEDLAIDAADADRAKLLAGNNAEAPPGPGVGPGVGSTIGPGNGSLPAAGTATARLAVAPEQLNFNYDIVGNAEFKPLQVFDDGASTYVQLRPGVQDVPALFRLINGDKDIELVDYVFRGGALVVPRVLDGGLLKLGREEVRFYNKTRVSRSLLGGYRFNDSGGRP